MNAKEYDFLAEQLAKEAEGIQTQKRPGYTGGNQDVLRNFKLVAERITTICPHCKEAHALSPEAVWSVYFLKHIDAILSIMNRPDLPVAEAPLGRFSDARNYGTLGYALQQERDDVASSDRHLRLQHEWLGNKFIDWGSKAATVLQAAPSDAPPATLPAATPSDPVQTAAPLEGNSGVPEISQGLEFRGEMVPVPLPPFSSRFSYVLRATPAIVAREAADDSSSPASGPDSGKVVLFHAPRLDTPTPNTN